MLRTPLCDLLHIKYPILQGALGPNDTSDLALAVSRAGALGVLSTLETDDMYAATRRQIQKLSQSASPFGLNIPVNSAPASHRLRASPAICGLISAPLRWLLQRLRATARGSPKERSKPKENSSSPAGATGR